MSSLTGTVGAQARILFSIGSRILQMKTRESPLGILSSLIEPLATILMMTLIFTAIRFRVPGLGDYLMLFFMTGTIPISIFRGGAMSAEQGYRQLRKVLVLPHLRPLDLMMGGTFLNTMVLTLLMVLMTAFFIVVYGVSWPENIAMCFVPLLGNSLLGLGIGAINITIKTWFPFWGVIFGTVTGPLGILSGMFFTAESMPPKIQAILYYNPLLHSTELLRTYFYPEFHSNFFDPLYYWGWVFGALAVGLLCERTFRYRLLHSKR